MGDRRSTLKGLLFALKQNNVKIMPSMGQILLLPDLLNDSKTLGFLKCNFCPFAMIIKLPYDLSSSYLHKD